MLLIEVQHVLSRIFGFSKLGANKNIYTWTINVTPKKCKYTQKTHSDREDCSSVSGRKTRLEVKVTSCKE